MFMICLFLCMLIFKTLHIFQNHCYINKLLMCLLLLTTCVNMRKLCYILHCNNKLYRHSLSAIFLLKFTTEDFFLLLSFLNIRLLSKNT